MKQINTHIPKGILLCLLLLTLTVTIIGTVIGYAPLSGDVQLGDYDDSYKDQQWHTIKYNPDQRALIGQDPVSDKDAWQDGGHWDAAIMTLSSRTSGVHSYTQKMDYYTTEIDLTVSSSPTFSRDRMFHGVCTGQIDEWPDEKGYLGASDGHAEGSGTGEVCNAVRQWYGWWLGKVSVHAIMVNQKGDHVGSKGKMQILTAEPQNRNDAKSESDSYGLSFNMAGDFAQFAGMPMVGYSWETSYQYNMYDMEIHKNTAIYEDELYSVGWEMKITDAFTEGSYHEEFCPAPVLALNDMDVTLTWIWSHPSNEPGRLEYKDVMPTDTTYSNYQQDPVTGAWVYVDPPVPTYLPIGTPDYEQLFVKLVIDTEYHAILRNCQPYWPASQGTIGVWNAPTQTILLPMMRIFPTPKP